jgi:hypothetical protein
VAPFCRLGVLSLVVLLVTACGAGGAADGRHQKPRYSIVLTKPVEPDWDAPLPRGICYVASKGYEVELTSRSELRPGLCDRLAERYLPHEPRLRWPPPYLREPDAAPSVVCVLADLVGIGWRSPTALPIRDDLTPMRSARRSSRPGGNAGRRSRASTVRADGTTTARGS